MVRTKLKTTSIFILACLLICSVFFAVTRLEASIKLTGSIKGKIVDAQGKAVEGAYVYLSSPNLLGIQYFLTKKNGYYFFHQLPTGTYKMAVETPGYNTAIINGITVETGKTLYLPVTLEVSQTEESEEKILLYPLPALDKEKPG
ncbi:MAG: carboxypeptidase-like regulatory domain-containing protein, partial [Candidatus Saccharicenans sp.]